MEQPEGKRHEYRVDQHSHGYPEEGGIVNPPGGEAVPDNECGPYPEENPERMIVASVRQEIIFHKQQRDKSHKQQGREPIGRPGQGE